MDKRDGDAGERLLFELLIRACRAHRRVVDRQFACLGIYGGQHHMLMYLAHLGGSAAQSDLNRGMDVSAATTANMLKRLEAGGYITREAQASDGRRNTVTLTDAGREVVDKSHRMFDRTDQAMFSGLTEEALDSLRESLTQINANLRRLEEQLDAADAAGKE